MAIAGLDGFSPCQDLCAGYGPDDTPAAVPGRHGDRLFDPAVAAGSPSIPRSCGDGGFFSGMKLFSIQKVQYMDYRAANRRVAAGARRGSGPLSDPCRPSRREGDGEPYNYDASETYDGLGRRDPDEDSCPERQSEGGYQRDDAVRRLDPEEIPGTWL